MERGGNGEALCGWSYSIARLCRHQYPGLGNLLWFCKMLPLQETGLSSQNPGLQHTDMRACMHTQTPTDMVCQSVFPPNKAAVMEKNKTRGLQSGKTLPGLQQGKKSIFLAGVGF